MAQNLFKPKDKKSLRAKSKSELSKQAAELRKDLVEWKMKLKTGGVQNVREGKIIRKNLAVIETIKNEDLIENTSNKNVSK